MPHVHCYRNNTFTRRIYAFQKTRRIDAFQISPCLLFQIQKGVISKYVNCDSTHNEVLHQEAKLNAPTNTRTDDTQEHSLMLIANSWQEHTNIFFLPCDSS